MCYTAFSHDPTWVQNKGKVLLTLTVLDLYLSRVAKVLLKCNVTYVSVCRYDCLCVAVHVHSCMSSACYK